MYLREKLAHERFIEAKHINIELMKYAMEIIDREDEEKKKEKEKKLQEEGKDKGRSFVENNQLIINGMLFLVLVLLWFYFRGNNVLGYFIVGNNN